MVRARWHPESYGIRDRCITPPQLTSEKKTVRRRADADLWTTNRPDARLANRLTKNLKKNWFGATKRAGRCYSQSSVSVSTRVTVPAHRNLPVPEVQCQHLSARR